MDFGAALKKLRLERGLSQEEMGSLLGTSKQVISRYENGKRTPKVSHAATFAAILNVPLEYFTQENNPLSNIPSAEHPSWRTVPLLGEIACGEPILAQENIEGSVQVDNEVTCDFALRCKGDSMAPRLLDGDLVFIRQQPSVEQGQIAAVLIGSEATLKHVYISSVGVQLVADNPAYAPIILTGEEAQNVRILGKAVAYRRII